MMRIGDDFRELLVNKTMESGGMADIREIEFMDQNNIFKWKELNRPDANVFVGKFIRRKN